jgi:hypothetical protein
MNELASPERSQQPCRCKARVPCFYIWTRNPIALWYSLPGPTFMLDLIKFFLPFVAIVFLLFYVFFINPDVLIEFGWWLRDNF